MDGFVLSRIDGTSTVADLCSLTGLPEPDTLETLQRLLRLGAISVAGVAPAPAPTPLEPLELHEADVELSMDERRAVLGTFARLEETNFYDLLGVDPRADRKQIREAYFRLSKQFHPDTHFRQKLGSYKQKLEVIFRSLTQAYEVLSLRICDSSRPISQ